MRSNRPAQPRHTTPRRHQLACTPGSVAVRSKQQRLRQQTPVAPLPQVRRRRGRCRGHSGEGHAAHKCIATGGRAWRHRQIRPGARAAESSWATHENTPVRKGAGHTLRQMAGAGSVALAVPAQAELRMPGQGRPDPGPSRQRPGEQRNKKGSDRWSTRTRTQLHVSSSPKCERSAKHDGRGS